MPNNIQDDDPESNDNSIDAIVRRLGRVTAVLAKVTARLDTINQGLTQPVPVGSIQLVQGALTSARDQGNQVIRACDDIQRKLTPQ